MTAGTRLRRSILVVATLVAAFAVIGAPATAGAQTEPCDISNFTEGTQVNTAGYLICLGALAQPPNPAADCPAADFRVDGVADPYQIAPGGTTTFSGYGFAPNGQVEIFICSTPISIGNFTADSLGNIVQAVTIPVGTSLGAHTLAAVGPNPAGRTQVAYAAINVVSTSTPATTTTTAGTLPTTGSDTGRLLAVGGALILLGGAALFGLLRSRRSATA